jgi:FkbM family methyltransferase
LTDISENNGVSKYLRLPLKVVRKVQYCNELIMRGTGRKYGSYTHGESKSPDPNCSRDLREEAGIETLYDEKEKYLFVRAGSSKFRLSSQIFLYTLREVYKDAIYRFQPTKDCIVIDIGANVGVSSLFFAEMDRVKRVISYEPFTPTYEEMLKNVALNPETRHKITAVNEGLGKDNATLTVDFCPTHTTVSSVNGPIVNTGNRPLVKETIKIRAAVDIVREVIKENSSLELVLKIDCEGSEYEIIDALQAAGLLASVSIILMEWHIRGAKPLADVLGPAGFACLMPGVQTEKAGMIYAFRQLATGI